MSWVSYQEDSLDVKDEAARLQTSEPIRFISC